MLTSVRSELPIDNEKAITISECQPLQGGPGIHTNIPSSQTDKTLLT